MCATQWETSSQTSYTHTHTSEVYCLLVYNIVHKQTHNKHSNMNFVILEFSLLNI